MVQLKSKDMKKLILILLGLLVWVSSVTSQTTSTSSKKFKKPILIMEVIGGFNLPLHDLAGNNLEEFYNLQSYGTSTGFSAGYGVKFAVATLKQSQFRLNLNLMYSQFTRSENRAYNINYLPQGWPTVFVPPVVKSGTSSVRYNIPYVSVGFEYAIFIDRMYRSHFTFGTDINISFIAGRIYNQITYQNEAHNTIDLHTRLGFGLNTAYNVRFTEVFGMTFGLRYQLNNVLNRTASAKSGDYIDLNDASAPNISPALGSSRMIGSASIYGGFNFYIGTKK